METFDDNYIVHNLKLLWNVAVRNIILKMIELGDLESNLKYCASNSAAKAVSELISSIDKVSPRTENTNSYDLDVDRQRKTAALLEGLLYDLKMGINLTVLDENAELSNISANTRLTDSPLDSAIRSASDDPHSRDYVSAGHIVEQCLAVKLINPQVCFEVQYADKRHCITVAALKIGYKSVLIMDQIAADRTIASNRADLIFKERTSYTFSCAQFLMGTENFEAQNAWPVWVPVESLLDQSIPVAGLDRAIDPTNILYCYDTHNPLYINRSKIAYEKPDLYSVSCPNVKLTMTSIQHAVWNDCFSNLLLYRDPESGVRATNLAKMALVFDQADSLQTIGERYAVLQANYRILKTRSTVNLAEKEQQAFRAEWIACGKEMYLYMTALKRFSEKRQNVKNMQCVWEFELTIDGFYLVMLRDDLSPFCECSLANAKFFWSSNQDASSQNIFEVDSLHIVNILEPIGGYRDVLSALNREGKEIDYGRQKFIRLFWRETPPVGGISVVEHFEINIVPLLVQLTRELGREIMRFIFSSSQKKEDVTLKRSGSIPSSQKSKGVIPTRDLVAFSALGLVERKKQDMIQMQARAEASRSFIYIKVPEIDLCLSYRDKGSSLIDISNVKFLLPTIEYRNKTWTLLDMVQALKKGIILFI